MTWQKYLLIGLSLILIQIVVLYLQGHIFICKCGDVKLWYGALNSSQDSQHLTDWYTFSHIIHGFVFYWFFRLISRKRWSVWTCLMLSIGVEVGWEILENSPLIINRYREYTTSLMYYGDSIVNSVSDVVAMIVGFLIARKAPVWASIAIVVFLELWVGYTIRDNLTLNVIMLVYPLDAIKHWQWGM